MNRHHHDAIERRIVTKRDLLDALRSVLIAPRTDVRTPEKRPTKTEMDAKWRLDRDAND